MSAFKKGDRVKVEYEATVVARHGEDEAAVRIGQVSYLVPISALTKLPDPEPEWRNGDAVRINRCPCHEDETAIRCGQRWITSGGLGYSDAALNVYWRDGKVTILHKEGS